MWDINWNRRYDVIQRSTRENYGNGVLAHKDVVEPSKTLQEWADFYKGTDHESVCIFNKYRNSGR